MRTLRSHLFRSFQSIGGSLSRPRNILYREAADLAYHFHWSKENILSMNGGERKQWLSEINRIHEEEYRQRKKEVMEQVQEIIRLRKSDEENNSFSNY